MLYPNSIGSGLAYCPSVTSEQYWVRSCLLPKRNFWARHREAEQPLKAWHDESARAAWKKPTDIKAQYRNASILKNRRVVFNVKGNDFRLVVAVAYRIGVVGSWGQVLHSHKVGTQSLGSHTREPRGQVLPIAQA